MDWRRAPGRCVAGGLWRGKHSYALGELPLGSADYRASHQDVPLPGEAIRIGDAGLRCQARNKRPDPRQVHGAFLMNTRRRILGLHQYAYKGAALKFLALEPFVKHIEDSQ